MKKKKNIILIILVLVILSAGAWIYFKVLPLQKDAQQKEPTAMANMKMDGKDGNEKMSTATGDTGKNQDNSMHEVSLHTLIQPANGYVISTIPATALIQRKETIEINAIGYTAYNTNEVGAISARVNGRIEKLYVKYRYQLIKKGQKIMDIYSPELLTAQQNHLFLLKNDAANYSLINASKEKLLLLGFSGDQLQHLVQTQKPLLTVSVYSRYSGHIHEALNKGMTNDIPASTSMNEVLSLTTEELGLKEGMYLQKGQTVFKVYNADKIWALLNVYSSDQVFIKSGNKVSIVPEARPEKVFHSSISFIEPFFRPGNRTLTARVDIDNSVLQLPIGSQVKATIFSSPINAAWLPQEAIVSLGFEKVVFIKIGNGYKAHKITTGVAIKNLIQVTGGITPSDSVAINAQFLMDSESFIKVNSKN